MAYFAVIKYVVNIPNGSHAAPWIMLYGPEGGDKGQYFVRIDFMNNPVDLTLTQNGYALGTIMDYKHFAAVIDLLRNEKPVIFNWYPSKICVLSTSYEPVGEGEVSPNP
jgi:hypothetical protein